jgi:CHASE3 domain sensor protein
MASREPGENAKDSLSTIMAVTDLRFDQIEGLLKATRGDVDNLVSILQKDNGNPSVLHRLRVVERWIEQQDTKQESQKASEQHWFRWAADKVGPPIIQIVILLFALSVAPELLTLLKG